MTDEWRYQGPLSVDEFAEQVIFQAVDCTPLAETAIGALKAPIAALLIADADPEAERRSSGLRDAVLLEQVRPDHAFAGFIRAFVQSSQNICLIFDVFRGPGTPEVSYKHGVISRAMDEVFTILSNESSFEEILDSILWGTTAFGFLAIVARRPICASLDSWSAKCLMQAMNHPLVVVGECYDGDAFCGLVSESSLV